MEINILNCINNFNLSLFGIGITIFTVIFSFIFSKKGELDLLNNLLKQKDSIENSLRKGKAIDYIKKMRKINSHIILATIVSLIIYIIINIYIIFRDEEAIHNQNNSIHPIYYIVIFLSVLNIAYFFILLIIFVHKYFKQTCLK